MKINFDWLKKITLTVFKLEWLRIVVFSSLLTITLLHVDLHFFESTNKKNVKNYFTAIKFIKENEALLTSLVNNLDKIETNIQEVEAITCKCDISNEKLSHLQASIDALSEKLSYDKQITADKSLATFFDYKQKLVNDELKSLKKAINKISNELDNADEDNSSKIELLAKIDKNKYEMVTTGLKLSKGDIFYASKRPMEKLFSVKIKNDKLSKRNTLISVAVKASQFHPSLHKSPYYQPVKFNKQENEVIIIEKKFVSTGKKILLKIHKKDLEGIFLDKLRDESWCLYNINIADLKDNNLLKLNMPSDATLAANFDKYLIIQ